MDTTTKSFQTAPLEYFTREQLRLLHSTSMEILEDLGTDIHNDEALDPFRPGWRTHRGRTPGVHSHRPGRMGRAPGPRPGSPSMIARPGRPCIWKTGTSISAPGRIAPTFWDTYTGERRDFLEADIADSIRLVDALPYIDFTMSNGLGPDLPLEIQYQRKYAPDAPQHDQATGHYCGR